MCCKQTVCINYGQFNSNVYSIFGYNRIKIDILKPQAELSVQETGNN